MQTQPVPPKREVSPRPSPVAIWQRLLSHLLDRHYGLTLNDTPFGKDGVIQEHIDAGISLCDAVNFIVEKYDWYALIVAVLTRKLSRRFSPVSIFSAPAKPPG